MTHVESINAPVIFYQVSGPQRSGSRAPAPLMHRLHSVAASRGAPIRRPTPLLPMQGDLDAVVPPNQAELMHAKLKAKGLPTALVMYPGRQPNVPPASASRFCVSVPAMFRQPRDHAWLTIRTV